MIIPHLGQLLTYAAGTDAATIVWIARSFREEHRTALDWLNEHTGADIRFFGVEVRALRIGNSATAPFFDVIAKPNDWQKAVRAKTPETVSDARFPAFWKPLCDGSKEQHPALLGSRPAPSSLWLGIHIATTVHDPLRRGRNGGMARGARDRPG